VFINGRLPALVLAKRLVERLSSVLLRHFVDADDARQPAITPPGA
jgi:hypothetical protein